LYDKQYSNQAGSKCTSLGRYKIWGKYKGTYGESYRMIGLDSSNQNALSRNIVLHSMACIPDTDGVAPACVSDGCPAVSTNFLSSLSKTIDSRKKPLLLWIFDSNLEEAVVENQPATDGQGPNDTVVSEFHYCSLHCSDKLQYKELP
ncbi:MAG: murein L,D-transpeptidase catalytic domain family protein, partial [Bacteroidota bacterium]|nr:murein L,D-transpeptidase catalytic domain family protein [Bacteroidota bacterium]